MQLLASTGAHLIGGNEAAPFWELLRDLDGYQYIAGTTPFYRNNPILVRSDVKVTGMEFRKMCDAVGTSPARAATLVQYELQANAKSAPNLAKRAHIQTHLNAHIQVGGEPRNLPRVKEAIRHMVRLEAWIRELQADGYKVTVGGDFNWAWSADDDHDWTYSPEAVFARLGMVTAFDDPTVPAGGTLGTRRIDYVAFSPDDLEITGQRIVTGEHSDHRWVEVQFVTV